MSFSSQKLQQKKPPSKKTIAALKNSIINEVCPLINTRASTSQPNLSVPKICEYEATYKIAWGFKSYAAKNIITRYIDHDCTHKEKKLRFL